MLNKKLLSNAHITVTHCAKKTKIHEIIFKSPMVLERKQSLSIKLKKTDTSPENVTGKI